MSKGNTAGALAQIAKCHLFSIHQLKKISSCLQFPTDVLYVMPTKLGFSVDAAAGETVCHFLATSKKIGKHDQVY